MMIWQLLQVGHVAEAPLILVGKMWPGLVEWARTAMLSSNPPLANPRDMDIPRCVEGADEAIALIRKHHRQWKKTQGHAAAKRERSRNRGK
jgi:predicted Rossmann-fold nucleotide-binding protein